MAIKKILHIVGIMSGTSLDGVDFVLVRMKAAPSFQMQFVDHASIQFSKALKIKLLKATEQKLSVGEVAILHHELGQFYAQSLKRIRSNRKWKIDLVGLHGQTVFHSSGKASLQIGEPTYIRELLDTSVVSDFRQADIAMGGKGAPLATAFHQFLKDSQKLASAAFQNIGGIANVSAFVGKKSFSYDTGPGNMIMDQYISERSRKKMLYDKGGKLAARGLVQADLLEKMLRHSYFKEAPPKSCGREEFGEIFLKKYRTELNKLSFENAMATLTELTAKSIADSYKRHLSRIPQAVFVCGGGAKNSYLMERLQFHLPKSKVQTTDDIGWNSQHIEAAAFAYLAFLRFAGVAGNIPETTGAKKAVILGKLT